jgi:hypothetical protein
MGWLAPPPPVEPVKPVLEFWQAASRTIKLRHKQFHKKGTFFLTTLLYLPFFDRTLISQRS